MEPVTIGPCTLYNADCLTVLASMADDSVDCVVTSPPYNTLGSRVPLDPTGMFKGRDGFIKGINGVGYSDDMPEDQYQAWLTTVVEECLRVSRGLVWVNHKVRYREGEAVHPARFLRFPIYSEVIWDRGGSMALNCRRFAPSHEMFLGFGKPHFWDDSYNVRCSVWNVSPSRDDGVDFHPCPFPKKLIRPIVSSSCPKDGIVLDPFNGAATTGVVCVESGRGYIGVEKRPDYFEGSCKRIREAVRADRDSLWPAFPKEEAVAC